MTAAPPWVRCRSNRGGRVHGEIPHRSPGDHDRGVAVLIVHHSNTVPVIAEKLGAKIEPIADQEFDRLVVITIPTTGSPSVVTLRYSPPPVRE